MIDESDNGPLHKKCYQCKYCKSTRDIHVFHAQIVCKEHINMLKCPVS